MNSGICEAYTAKGLRRGAACTRLLLFGTGAVVLMLLPLVRLAAAAGALLPVPISTMPSNGDVNPYGVVLVAGTRGGS
jgi:hypothetical protein